MGGVCSMHVGIFDLEHVKVIWGHSVHFSENWAITQNRLNVERNGQNLGLSAVCNMHVGIFYFEHMKVTCGHSVHFSENWPVSQERLIKEQNG